MTEETKQDSSRPAASTNGNYRVLGTRPIRHDGADKVTGKAIYTADVKKPSMANGFILRSPHAHALIKSIDTSEAESMEGVLAVMTADDLPDVANKIADLGEGSVNLANLSNNILADGKVLYRGHAVAAVAAINVHIAEEAANRIKVKYEPLPSVTWVLDAMQEDAPLLHEDVYTKSGGEQSDEPSNVAVHLTFEQGDIQKGFEEADVVVEREFKMATVHQGYIEPHAVLVDWNQDGRIKVWASTQGSFTCRQQTAEVLQVPLSHVTVVPCEIGGGFGGKIPIYLEPVAAVLSRKTGRPVQIVMRRNDVFEGTGPTPGAFVRVKLGATKEGKLTAGEAWLAYESGAYPGGMLGPGCMCVFSCYDIPNALVDGFEVCLNKPHIKAYRAPGATQAAFATESVMDELAEKHLVQLAVILAEKLGIDILELQQKNAAKEGTRRVDGPVYPRVGLVECLDAAAASDHWNTPLEGANRGRGIASGFWFGCGLKSSVVTSVNSDGTVNLTEGSTDIGGTRTSIAMQLAEVLGLDAEDINPQVVDTDNIGYTDVTGGSRTTFATGMAAYEAGRDLQQQMVVRAADLWECEPGDVQITNGVFAANGNEANFKELATQLFKAGEPLVGRATVAPECSTNGFGTHIADVEVDTETGKVTILRYTVIQDAGKAVHPSYVEGQLQGGAVQGIGWALNEEYFFDDQGEMRNASFLDYRMPTSYDLPMIDTIIVEAENPEHPYGVRGVGETPIVPPPAALANAIYNAVGVRMTELPMSPPRLWKAIQQNQNGA